MKRQLKIEIGLRLFIAGLMLFCLNSPVLAGVALLFPGMYYSPRILATGMTQEEELLEKITGQVKKLIADSQKENASKSEIEKAVDKINKEIQSLTDDQKKALKEKCDELAKTNENLQAELAKAQKQISEANETLTKQGADLKKLMDSGIGNKPELNVKSFREVLKAAIFEQNNSQKFLVEKNDTEGKRVSLKDFFESNPNSKIVIKLDMPVEQVNKVAVDMTQANIVQSNVSALRLTQLDPQRVGIPLTIYPHVMDVFMTKQIKTTNMALLVVYSYEDGAGTKTEGSASAKSSLLLKTVSFKSFYVATHFVLSDETLDDLDEALDEINIVAPSKILDKIDSKILGSSGDDSSDIAGILTANKKTDFDNTNFLNSIEGANVIDVIACAKRQAEIAKYRPDVVYMNPTDVMFLAAAKNTFEDSRLDRRVTYDAVGNPATVYGLRIIQSEVITQNECIVLERAQTMIGRRIEMTMEIGYNGTDLTEGQKTVVLKTRLAFGVRDKAAIVYVDDLAGEVTSITKTS